MSRGVLLRMDLTLDEAETLEEALDAYRHGIIADLDGEPSIIQSHAISTATTIGKALRTSIEKHRLLAAKGGFKGKKR